MVDKHTDAELELAAALVVALNLDGKSAADIEPTAPLFGFGPDQRGLGLDSIDALEIALVVQQKYGIEIRSEDPDVKQAFSSLRNLAAHVAQRRRA